MQSMQRLKPLVPKSKKGQLGLELVSPIIKTVLGIIVLAIVFFVVVVALRDSGILTAGQSEINATNTLIDNTSTGLTNISNRLPTIFLILAVVVIIGAVVLILRLIGKGGVGGV